MTAMTSRAMGAGATPSRGLFIDGTEAPAPSHEQIDVLNPATGEVIARIAHGTPQDVDRSIQSARRAFESKEWGGMEVHARARLVNRLAETLEEHLPELSRLETSIYGRPALEP